MADTTLIKSELRKALDSLMEMATDAELLVLSGMIDVQLRKAVFLRGAHQYGFDAEQLARFHQEFIVAHEPVYKRPLCSDPLQDAPMPPIINTTRHIAAFATAAFLRFCPRTKDRYSFALGQ